MIVAMCIWKKRKLLVLSSIGRKTTANNRSDKVFNHWFVEISFVTWLQNHAKEESEIYHNKGDSYGITVNLQKRTSSTKIGSKPGRLYVGRWNERVRAKRCDAEDWGLLKRGDSTYLQSNFDFLKKKLHETPFYVNQQLFCSEAFAKGEFFWDENRTLNFALWMSKIFSR